jgi:tetratricopeptide (TPR) repeat protein
MATTDTRITDEIVREAVAAATAAMRAGDVAAAHRIAQAGIEAGMEDAFLYKVEGLWLQNRGEHVEALRIFHHARELDPQDPMTLVGIAGTLGGMGQHGAALAMTQAALELAPDLVSANHMHAWTLEALRDYRAAKAAYERTLALKPNHAPALAGLAATAVRLQDHALARAKAEQALALAPGQPTAMTALAMTEIAAGQPRKAETLMRALLARPIGPAAKAVAQGVLGDALDAQERVDEAFAAYRAENDILNAQRPAEAGAGVGQALARLAEALEATTAPWPATATSPQPARGHVFLLGFMRSGTTLLERALASHPDIAVLDEVDLLAEPFAQFLESEDGLARLEAATDAELDDARAAYWTGLRGRGIAPENRIVLDKLPLNTNKLPLIARLFPQAKVLFAVRDPRDVVLSCYRRHFEVNALTAEFHTLEDAARLYDATMRVGAWSRANLPLAFHEVRHERLVEDFEAGLRGLCAFIGLEWTDALMALAAPTTARGLAALSAPQLSRGLNNEGVGRWRAYAAHLGPALPILEPWVRRFGYPD